MPGALEVLCRRGCVWPPPGQRSGLIPDSNSLGFCLLIGPLKPLKAFIYFKRPSPTHISFPPSQVFLDPSPTPLVYSST